ncbi:MAG: aconitate hydratase [Candidatus Eisenbacteria sp.]|nr:aconitate hydratase [Candidatus Eisenbacteria bacterium]
MGDNIVQKILSEHLVSGELGSGREIGLRIDQTLTQDATGTMAYLQFEAMKVPRVKTKISVSYVDHNTLQTGYENPDDHLFLQSVAAKYGVRFSRPGNGICHQVHLERFGIPGMTLLGSDHHTPTAGGIGMIGIEASGLDVAVAMAGELFYLTVPQVVLVRLTGKLRPWVSAKDVILDLLRRLTVEGGVGKIFEYGGPGVQTLSVPERATIANMGAELGATTSVFPSDRATRTFLAGQKRVKLWKELVADRDAEYDEVIDLQLDKIESLAAKPHMPDRVVPVRKLTKVGVSQVCVGSCTNSSYRDLMTVAGILKGKTVHPGVSLIVAPGSKQVFSMIAKSGGLASLIASGARIAESACGFCIGMGHAPGSGEVSVRTSNCNFEGWSGTKTAAIYLVSPETAAATALKGRITDPRTLAGRPPRVAIPKTFVVDDNMVIKPPRDGSKVKIRRGPNIQPLPRKETLPETLSSKVLLKVGDDTTTDDIMPVPASIIPLRSNIPAISEYVFSNVDPTFARRARDHGGGFIVGGFNYGLGLSREHAALAPMYLGIQFVMAKSFTPLHLADLINCGILPLVFLNERDYDVLDQEDWLEIRDVPRHLGRNERFLVRNHSKSTQFEVDYDLSDRQKEILLAGGLLNCTSAKAKKAARKRK